MPSGAAALWFCGYPMRPRAGIISGRALADTRLMAMYRLMSAQLTASSIPAAATASSFITVPTTWGPPSLLSSLAGALDGPACTPVCLRRYDRCFGIRHHLATTLAGLERAAYHLAVRLGLLGAMRSYPAGPEYERDPQCHRAGEGQGHDAEPVIRDGHGAHLLASSFPLLRR